MDGDTPALTTQRRGHALLALFFAGCLLAGLVGSLLPFDLMPLFREQRRLAAAADIAASRTPGEVAASLTNYFADNFGLRKPLISGYFHVRLHWLKADLGLPVVLGDDGWLFYGEELADFSRRPTVPAAKAAGVRSRLDAWCDHARRHGAQLVVMVAPNKSTIHPDKVPARLQPRTSGPSVLDQVQALDYRCPFAFADLRPLLRAHRDEGLYFRWGTHWTDRGAQLAWEGLKAAASAQAPDLRWPAVEVALAAGPARPLEDSLWQWFGESDPHPTQVPRAMVRNLAPAANARTATAAPAGGRSPRTLVFGDSFLGFMANTAGIVATDAALWDLRSGARFAPSPGDHGKDGWGLIGGQDRRIELMHALRANVVVVEIVERSVLGLADLPLPIEAGLDRPADITDDNWHNGIARRWAGFVLHHSGEAARNYAVGTPVRFVDGQVRTVTGVRASGSYLDVELSGPPLDGARSGFPNPVTRPGAAL